MKPVVRNRKFMIARFAGLTTLLFVMIFIGSPQLGSTDAALAPVLGIVSTGRIPLVGVSGLGWAEAVGQESTIVAVSDREPVFTRSRIRGEKFEVVASVDFREALLERFSVCGHAATPGCQKMAEWINGQWEAVATDGANRVFLLHEKAQSVIVLDKMGKNVIGHWELDFAKLGLPQSGMQENKMGEGLVLLANGHILVAKEAGPALVIEFAQQGDAAGSSILPLAAGAEFPGAEGHKRMVPVRRWLLDREFDRCDLSDLAMSSRGELFILSQTCRMVGKVMSGAGRTLVLSQVWKIPEVVKHPEGLVLLKDGSFGVSDDSNNRMRQNFFMLRSIAAPSVAVH